MKQFYVYVLTNFTNTVLYTGVTNDLVRRVFEHKKDIVKGFSNKYKTHKLVYFELLSDPLEAIKREKAIKNLLREKKFILIRSMNPRMNDLYTQIV